MTGVRCAEQPPAGVVSNQRGLLSPPPPPRCAQLVCAGSGLLHWLVPVLGAQLRSRDEERASKKSEHLPEMSQLQRAELGNFPGCPVVKTASMPGVWVPFLVRELRSHLPHSWPKNK